MQRDHRKLPTLRALAFALLVACGVNAAATEGRGAQSPAQKARDKEQHWRMVAQLIEEANEIRRREVAGDSTLAHRRMELFKKAAEAAVEYVRHDVQVGDTVEYVVEVFRLGVLWEQAGNDYEAKNNYDECDRKESKYNAKASYDGKQLLPQLRKRLAVVNGRLERLRLQEIRTESGGGTSQDYGG